MGSTTSSSTKPDEEEIVRSVIKQIMEEAIEKCVKYTDCSNVNDGEKEWTLIGNIVDESVLDTDDEDCAEDDDDEDVGNPKEEVLEVFITEDSKEENGEVFDEKLHDNLSATPKSKDKISEPKKDDINPETNDTKNMINDILGEVLDFKLKDIFVDAPKSEDTKHMINYILGEVLDDKLKDIFVDTPKSEDIVSEPKKAEPITTVTEAPMMIKYDEAGTKNMMSDIFVEVLNKLAI